MKTKPPARPARSDRPVRPRHTAPRYGLARILSKAGLCSRSQAAAWIAAGRVAVDGRRIKDPEYPTDLARQQVTVDGAPLRSASRVYLALNKPRGLLATAADERGRATIYGLLEAQGLPWLGPVGRLDMASEGLLLLTNDSAWAAALLDPKQAVVKTYHVQIDCLPSPELLQQLREGVSDQGEHLVVHAVSLLRQGQKQAWLEIALTEGRNRHIRRLLAACDVGVKRLLRVTIGPLALGRLAKGQWRHLEAAEVAALAAASGACRHAQSVLDH